MASRYTCILIVLLNSVYLYFRVHLCLFVLVSLTLTFKYIFFQLAALAFLAFRLFQATSTRIISCTYFFFSCSNYGVK